MVEIAGQLYTAQFAPMDWWLQYPSSCPGPLEVPSQGLEGTGTCTLCAAILHLFFCIHFISKAGQYQRVFPTTLHGRIATKTSLAATSRTRAKTWQQLPCSEDVTAPWESKEGNDEPKFQELYFYMGIFHQWFLLSSLPSLTSHPEQVYHPFHGCSELPQRWPYFSNKLNCHNAFLPTLFFKNMWALAARELFWKN